MQLSDQGGDDWPPEMLEKVTHDRVAREAVRKHYPSLFTAVSEAMFRHDLIGINFESNTDEYDPEAGTVIPRLNTCPYQAVQRPCESAKGAAALRPHNGTIKIVDLCVAQSLIDVTPRRESRRLDALGIGRRDVSVCHIDIQDLDDDLLIL
jgi:hypothetical protein